MNGWTPTPTNKERVEYDAERAQIFEARALALTIQTENPITKAEADRLHELIEEALSYETGLPFLALSDTVSIAITPKVARFMDAPEVAQRDVIQDTTPAWQIEAEAQAADAADWTQQTSELRAG